jgi:hypothetical protein
MSKSIQALLSAVCLAAIPIAAGAADAAILYENPTTLDHSFNQTPIQKDLLNGYYAGNSFTLSARSIVKGISFLSWNDPGDQITSIGWSIQTGKNGTGIGLAGGNTTTNSNFFAVNFYVREIDQNSFIIPDLTLDAGTYWLYLGGALTYNYGPVGWDASKGPSAYDNNSGRDVGNSFFVLGDIAPRSGGGTICNTDGCIDEPVSPLPEPSMWAAMILGFGAIGATLRARRPRRMACLG